jgi:hypothetical protein
MIMTTTELPTERRPHEQHRPGKAATVGLGIAAAIVPALAGLVLLGSAALRRPLLAAWVARPGDGARDTQRQRRAASLSVLWGLGLLIAGGLQALMAIAGALALTDPLGFLFRTLVGLAAEAILVVVTPWWLRVRLGESPDGVRDRVVEK